MRQPYAATADAAGEATITVRPRDSRGWRVTQVSVSMAAGSASSVSGSATCAVRVNGFLVAPAVAQGDAVAGDPPVDLEPGDEMTIEWVAANAGNICSALLFYDPIRS